MPKVMIPCPDINQTVARPVIFDVTRQILRNTGLNENIKIFYPGETEKDLQPDSAINPIDDSQLFQGNERFSVEVDEEYDESRVFATTIHQKEQPLIFNDNDTKVFIKPVYTTSKITINVRYKTSDREKAVRWREDIRNRASMLRSVFIHDIEYKYTIPFELLYVLAEVHQRREAVLPYNETVDQYITRYLDSRGSVTMSLDGKNKLLGIRETQINVQGYFDFDIAPEKVSKDDDVSWVIGFSYKFTYEKPTACAITYPVLVHNSLLPEGYVKLERDTLDLEKRAQMRSLSLDAFRGFEVTKDPNYRGMTAGIQIPDFDDFIPNYTSPKTVRLFTALTTISVEDKRTLFSIDQLGDYELTPTILTFMKNEGANMLTPFKSVFSVTLYEDEFALPSDYLVIDGLDVNAKVDLNPRKQYRVRVGVLTDWSLLTKEALERLRTNGLVAFEIARAIKPNLQTLPDLTYNKFKPKDLLKIIAELNNSTLRGNYCFNTVQTLFIQSMRG